MKKYIVNVHYGMIQQMEVYAESEDEAIEMAEREFPNEDCSEDDFDSIIDSCVFDEM